MELELKGNTGGSPDANDCSFRIGHDDTDTGSTSNELHLKNFLENAPVGIHWVDARGIVTWANRSELEMLGYSREEYVGQHISRFHADADVINEVLGRLRNGESLTNYEVRLRHKDGSIRYGLVNSNVLWKDDSLIRTHCFTRDITEKKQLEEKAQAQFDELENIYRTAPIGLALIDKDFCFARVNQRLAEINGLSPEQHLGRNLREVLPDLADQAEEVFREVFETGKPVLNVEFEGETPIQPGVRRIWNESWYPLKAGTGETIAISVIVEEITDRKRAGAALERSAQQKEALYQLVDRLHRTKSLEEIYDAALHAIVSALPCDRASILLFDDSDTMRFVGWCGLSEIYRDAVEGHSPWKRDTTSPDPICVDDIETADIDAGLKATVLQEGIRALAFIPLVSHNKLIGKFMTYFDMPHIFGSDEIELSLAIARQLAFAIERKRAEEAMRESERRFREMIEALPAAIYTTDANGRLTHFNSAAVKLSGRLPQLGTDEWCITWKLYHPDGTFMPHDTCPMATSLKQDRLIRDAEAIAERPDGTRVWFEAYPTPLHDSQGRLVGGINMLMDITERKRAEDALRRSEERLKEVDRRKDEFLAMLAHELRNPLAPIMNAVQLLRRDPMQDPVQQQARGIIERQTGRLAHLVDDLLEVSRITSGRIRLHMERIAIGGVIQRAVETVRPLIERHRHRFTLSVPTEPIWLYADVTRLEQVLVNLLNNAAKYTEDGGEIELATRPKDHRVVISVRDNGIGIEPELLPHIFDLFTQSERSLDRSHGGLGIGLSLVQRLVEMHGGQVTAKSIVGHGSEFIVQLPTASEPMSEACAIAASTDETAARSLRILVVDDNVDTAQSLAMLLEATGHTVWIAHEGLTALEAALEHGPHIVFLDVGLPKLDGYEVVQRLRRHPRGNQMVVVAITGYGQAADRERAREAGFDHHLVKPVEFSDIERVIMEISRVHIV